MFEDFREYIDHLERIGKLRRITREVDTRFEIAAAIRKVSDTDGPAILFEKVKGYPGWTVAGGIYATKKLLAVALGLPQDASEWQMTQRYLEFDEKYVKPQLVSSGPVKEVVIKGEGVDLTKLPVPIYSARDGGAYLAAGVEIARHPDTGAQNVAIHRRKVLGKDKTTLLARPFQHLGRMVLAAERRGIGLGVATVIGTAPGVVLASQVKAPEGVDETEVAGAILGEPVKVVKCETIDVNVPANAEIVIEGVTIPGERVECGPFGEYPGNYISMTGAPRVLTPVVKVTAITMRKNPIFQAMLTGMPMTENHFLKQWAVAAKAYREASKISEVKAVNPTRGSAGFHYVVSIKKRSDGEPRALIYALFAAPLLARQVTIVDDDINVYDPNDVEWAVSTRTLPHKDILIMPPVSRGPEEPSPADQMTSRWGIDATMPLKYREWYEKVSVPGVDKIDYV